MASFDLSSLLGDWLIDYDSIYTHITEDTPTITSDRTKGDPKCTTVQNFCANCQIGKEIISADLLDLTTTAPIIQKNETTGEMAPVLGATKVRPYEQYDVITNELWEQIKRILQELHDYGLLGDREHPSQTAIDSLKKPTRQSIIYGHEYNNLLDIVSQYIKSNPDYVIENITETQWDIIRIEIIEKIQDYLNNYEIDFNRCNNCNATENCAQCHCHCDCHCDCDGGGGGGGGGGCCMYGACTDAANSGCDCLQTCSQGGYA